MPVYAVRHSLLIVALILPLAFAGCGRESGEPVGGPSDGVPPLFSGDPGARAQARGITWLATQQGEDGMFRSKVPEIGITGLAVAALAGSPQAETPEVKAAIERGLQALLPCQAKSGTFSMPGPRGYDNYRTAIAVLALNAADREQYAEPIRMAQAALAAFQQGPHTGADPEKHKERFGGWNYQEEKGRADLSNTQLAMQALAESDFDPDSEVWEHAITFLQRCQNRTESNDAFSGGNDGGGFYAPTETKVEGDVVTLPDGRIVLKSYGSMTFALLKCYIYAGLDRDDPRVQAAYGWIRANYSVDECPGLGKQGLYYYYSTMATALELYGEPTVTSPDGQVHNWAADLVQRLSELQRADGSWANEKADRWMEDDPVLATSYALLALNKGLEALRAGP